MASSLAGLNTMPPDVRDIFMTLVKGKPSRKGPDARRESQEEIKCVMCPPKYLSDKISNNVYMDEKSEKIDVKAAMKQYDRIKILIESLGTEVLEIPPDPACQDQSYTANVAVCLGPKDVVVSKFSAAGRPPEEKPAMDFFKKLGCKVQQSPHYFEGEADCKWLRDDIYFGGYGMFSDARTYDWMMDNYDVEVVPLQIVNEYLYHLDCSIFVLDDQNVLVTKEGLAPESVKLISKYAEPHFTPPEYQKGGLTNMLKVPRVPICIWEEEPTDDAKTTKKVMDWHEKLLDKFGLVLVTVGIGDFAASGADLSCMVMHLEM